MLVLVITSVTITSCTLTPHAEVRAVYRPPYTLVANDIEIPHPEHDYLEGHLWVNSITGGPNELRPVAQVSFTAQPPSPFHIPDFALKYTDGTRVQTKALGVQHHAPSKMRGR
jgi:hypothetical protein